ncbi:MAG: DUF2304 domain-containing protein [Clostridia bacterium]|nr:DUF2304 domain-containing protein [Clostridia bacterium]
MSIRLRILLLIAVLLAFIYIIKMIHRKKLSVNYSLMWLGLGFVLLLFVLFPEIVYSLARLSGVQLPINMLLIAFAFFAMIMLLFLTSIVSKHNEKNRALTQQLALLEKRVRELEGQLKEKE